MMYNYLKSYLQLMMILMLIGIVTNVCPNNCSGHGVCDENERCTCFSQVGLTSDGKSESYTGVDCSLRKCPVGNPFSSVYSLYPGVSGNALNPVNVKSSSVESKSSSRRNLADDGVIKAGTFKVDKNFQVSLIKTMNTVGGLLECNNRSDIVIADIKGYNKDTITLYVTFDRDIDDSSVSGFECKVIQNRTDLTMINPTVITDATTEITWKGYTDILLNIGIIKLTDAAADDYTAVTFSQSLTTPSFACYIKESDSLKLTEAKTDKVEAVNPNPNTIPRRRNLDGSKLADIKFTFSSEISAKSVCYLLVDKDGNGNEIAFTDFIAKSDLGKNVREDGENSKLGKYDPTSASRVETTKVDDDKITHKVIVFGGDDKIENGQMTLTKFDEKWADVETYLNISRTVYLTLQDNEYYQIFEYPIVITNSTLDEDSKLTVTFDKLPFIDEDDEFTIFQYIRTFPSDETNLIRNGELVNKKLYKQYNFNQDEVVKKLDNLYGGLLRCTYSDGGNPDPDSLVYGVVDVKGYKMNYDSNILYTYVKYEYEIEPPEVIVDARLLGNPTKITECDKIIMKRNDLSLFNPTTIVKKEEKDAKQNEIFWTGYKDILSDMNFKLKAKKPKFACRDNSDVISLYNIISYNNEKFTVSSSKYPKEDDICYLLSSSNGESIDIMESDLGKNVEEVRYENGTIEYFFKVIKDIDASSENKIEIITEREDNNTLIVLDGTDNLIEIEVLTAAASTPEPKGKITIKDEDKDFVKEILVKDREVYLSLIYDNIIIEEKIILKDTTLTFDCLFGKSDNYKYLNYIRTYPVYSYSNIPKPSSGATAINGNLWKVYNLNTEKIPNFSSVGGKLQCTYTTSDPVPTTTYYEADIKGKVLNDIQSTYVLFNGTDVSSIAFADLKCDRYLSIRNDLSLYNPSNFAKDDSSFTWTGYGRILYDMGFYPNETEGDSTFQYKRMIDVGCVASDILTVYENVTVTTTVTEKNGIPDNAEDVTFTFYNELKPSDACVCYVLSDGRGNKMEVLETELGINMRENKEEGGDVIYKVGKFETSEEGVITTTTEEGRIVIITPEKEIKATKSDSSGDKLDTLELTGQPDTASNLYLQENLFIYLTIRIENVIQPEFKTRIDKVVTATSRRRSLAANKITLTIDPSLPPNSVVLNGIRTSPNDLGNEIDSIECPTPAPSGSDPVTYPIDAIDANKHLYKIKSGAVENIQSLINQMNKLGGTIQCTYKGKGKYKEPVLEDILGTADIKTFDISTDDVYIEFLYSLVEEKVPTTAPRRRGLEEIFYKINEIECNKIISIRNDLSLLNPSTVESNVKNRLLNDNSNNRYLVSDDENDYYKIVWIGYKSILKVIGFLKEDEKNKGDYIIPSYATFGCIEKDNNKDGKKIEFYNASIEISSQSEVVTFIFNKKDENNKLLIKQPVLGTTCYLLSNEEGIVMNIEESDLFNYVRKNKDGSYNLGKYVEVTDDVIYTGVELDGSVTLIIGRNNVDDSSGEADKDADKINIKENTVSIPIKLIEDTTRKMLVVGSSVSISEIHSSLNYKELGVFQIMDIKSSNNKVVLILSGTIPITPMVELPPDEPRERERERERLLVEEEESESNKTINTNSTTTNDNDNDNNRRILSSAKIPPNVVLGYEIEFRSAATTHVPIECSGQGECDRSSGLCKCYSGFTGNACQRIECANNCNGNGRCVPLRELLKNDELKDYKGYGNALSEEQSSGEKVIFNDELFGCLCDKRHRGYDCSLIECPSGVDPVDSTGSDEVKRDCSGRGICNYVSGVCDCFEGFSGEGCQYMSSVF